MRFSVWPSPQRPWSETVAIVTACDSAGWDGAWFPDHFMPDSPDGLPVDGPILESMAVLAALAAVTDHVRLGTLVCGNLYRHPAVLAKAATTIDRISAGRFVLGVGAGWQINEHAAYGIDLLDVRNRLDRFEEACAVLRSMLTSDRTTFDGQWYSVTDAPCDPRPVDRLPLLVGGKGERRTMRIAATFADEWNAWCTPPEFRQKAEVLAGHCGAIGRDVGELTCSTQALVFLSENESWLARFRDQPPGRPVMVGTPSEMVDQVAAYRDAGVDELIIPDWMMGDGSRAVDTLALFWEQVAVDFR